MRELVEYTVFAVVGAALIGLIWAHNVWNVGRDCPPYCPCGGGR